MLPRGGGATWVTGSYDPELNLLYWGTGNPNPDYYGDDRKGDNLYTASLVALDADTGKLKWHYQFTPHDTARLGLQPRAGAGRCSPSAASARKVVMVANRNGFFYALDRVTGKLLVGKPFTDTTWARELGPDGHPIVLNDGVVPPDGTEATTPCVPDLRGGTDFKPPSFDPALQLFFVMARETCATYTPEKQEIAARPQLHGRRHARSWPSPTTARCARSTRRPASIKWEYKFTHVVARRRDVHRVGPGVRRRQRRQLHRLRLATGKNLWHYRTGSPIWGAAAMTYMLDGRQYVLIPSGTRSRRSRCRRIESIERSGRRTSVLARALIGAVARRRPGAALFAAATAAAADLLQRRDARSASSPVATRLSHPWSLAFLPDGIDARHRARRAGCASSATACSIPRRSPACPGRRARARRTAGDRAASALCPEPLRLSDLLEGARGQALHDGAGARPTSTARRSTDVEGHLRRQHVEQVEHELRRPHRVRSRRLPLSHRRRAPGAGPRAEPEEHGGKVLRLRDDGTAPPDNPFAGKPGYLPEIYTLGHRSPQGLALNPDDRRAVGERARPARRRRAQHPEAGRATTAGRS